jgi:hypothetical protein
MVGEILPERDLQVVSGAIAQATAPYQGSRGPQAQAENVRGQDTARTGYGTQ